jgi:hypothetical protein
MKTGLTTFAKCFGTGSFLLGTILAVAQQPSIITTTATGGMAPNGVGVTTNELLFSQPYCDGVQPRGIYQATNFVSGGTGILDATMIKLFALPAQAGCSGTRGAENYFAISSGLGGFTLGSVYATSPNGSGGDAVYKDGALFIPSIADPAPGHAGITFDNVGSFNNYLFITTPSGVFGYDSGGNLQLTFPAPVATSTFESATVAPTGNSACAGCLYITSDTIGGGQGSIYIVPAHSPTGTSPTFVTLVPGTEPEGIQFITAQACTLNGTDLSYFVSGYAHGSQIENGFATNGALLGYTQTQVSPFVGQALIPIEVGGTIYAYNPTTNAFTVFSTPTAPGTTDLYQFEGSTLAECAPAPTNSKGRMTGGGSFFTPDGTRVTHGFELHCSVPSHPNNLEVNWLGNHFHMDTLTSVTCFEDPAFYQGQPHADFNTMIGTGTGTFNGSPGTIRFEFTDAGEPGVNDKASVTIQSGTFTFTVPLTVLKNGNQQAHK